MLLWYTRRVHIHVHLVKSGHFNVTNRLTDFICVYSNSRCFQPAFLYNETSHQTQSLSRIVGPRQAGSEFCPFSDHEVLNTGNIARQKELLL